MVYSNAPKVELYRNGTLIGTATRKVNTTSAGHKYYTYTTTSNDSSVCTAVSGSNSTSLYATFNVAYEAGTISAKAYDEDGNEITKTSGNASVSTPGTVSKLNVQTNKTEILADGSSLAYISVDVTDAEGNLDTTAINTINFSLSGNGEIVGVDNGDQATTEKGQQSSVLTSTTSAKIAAYAGKALVIVRSTKDAGSFTVNVSSSGLTGGSVTVVTLEQAETCKHENTTLYNAKEATCTEDGYTGDEICSVCGETVSTGTVIPATGHSWDSGVVTKEATTQEEGIKTYTCTVCSETKTESIPKLEEIKTLKVPSITLSASQNNRKIKLTGTVADYESKDDYYTITGQGFVYMTKTALGAKSLNVNTSGRTKVNITSIGSKGTYSYSMTPKSSSTTYVIRAYLTYTDSKGKTVYVYSDSLYTSYNSLTK